MASAASAPSLRRAFEEAIDALRELGSDGAFLVSRDGFPLAGGIEGVSRPEMFAAMHATALGAAEIAFDQASASGIMLIAEHGGRRFLSRGLTKGLFVVAALSASADHHAVAAAFDSLADRMARV